MAPQRSPGQTVVALVALGLACVAGPSCAVGQGNEGSDTNPGLGSGGPASSDDGTITPIDSADSGEGQPVCGNGQVEAGESCDDGNDDDTDACTSLCAAPSCDDGLQSGDETDVDCGGSCAACTGGGCRTTSDCEAGVCIDGTCAHPRSCRELLEQVPGTPDGVQTIDPDGDGGVAPFSVSCDMTSEGGGFIRLSLQHSDGVIVAQNAADNPWHKCADDAAKHFSWIDEGTISADFSPGEFLDEEVELSYQNPADGTTYSSAQVEALRTVVSELATSTRMVAVTADDDGADWDADMVNGHEVYVRGALGTWILLTPGTNGDCGGSPGAWPIADTESAFYLWTHDAGGSAVDGVTGLSDISGVGSEVLPDAVRLVVQSGGGVAFGWEQPVFLVR
ncbi:fibrinogen-like YCDxxxxGGGW domain-containing protein [Paraliomyxa miuraensis]|uniref:fibrinogen-like YCDxxxxGGGW domain-containing protein n=1 Tax=Paraliomyxa miuraensis TaxID=376150 RepID=UPI0022584152|nr:fibrinogen-like YCDxxxxGGGW domain-containing protein [Paraliomyxa miuraensis]MCX4244875.1 fibrinogen-like YCDxxxxGGGW domain-containing protein [Paraliomyxa miuraensis]